MIALPTQEAYPNDTHYNRYINEPDMNPCFIYGEDLESITLEGYGIINGNGQKFPLQGGIVRPMMIRLLRCKMYFVIGLCRYPNSKIGSIKGVTIDNMRITEDMEMKNIHRRFDVDVMGK